METKMAHNRMEVLEQRMKIYQMKKAIKMAHRKQIQVEKRIRKMETLEKLIQMVVVFPASIYLLLKIYSNS